ncbi:MAG: DUF1566 domain-containing protein [Treponema sp.]|nr:DUF1566 domain-containing protein [Treponema sp.]
MEKNKNKIWLFIAVIALIGFVAVSCDNGDNGNSHTHTPGAAATCTTAQTCTECSAVIQAATGHTPGVTATCNTAQTCTVCDTVIQAATGQHTWGNWTVTSTTYPAQSTKTCSCGETDGSPRNTEVGDTGPGGGKIFYVLAEGFTVTGEGLAHYLEIAPVDQGSLTWSSTNVNVSGTEQTIGNGKANTAAIIAAHSDDTTANNAAKAAVAYNGGGKNDWFLPSFRELEKIRELEFSQLSSHFNISAASRYWASSQPSTGGANNAHSVVSSGSSATDSSAKTTSLRVRAVRTF